MASLSSYVVSATVLTLMYSALAGRSGEHPSHATDPATNASHASPQAVLDGNSRLDAPLQKQPPAGTTPQQACAGFRELGACIPALHVADNLQIPSDDLKSRMTGGDSSSFGAASHALRPSADAEHTQHEAEKQTRRDLAATAD